MVWAQQPASPESSHSSSSARPPSLPVPAHRTDEMSDVLLRVWLLLVLRCCTSANLLCSGLVCDSSNGSGVNRSSRINVCDAPCHSFCVLLDELRGRKQKFSKLDRETLFSSDKSHSPCQPFRPTSQETEGCSTFLQNEFAGTFVPLSCFRDSCASAPPFHASIGSRYLHNARLRCLCLESSRAAEARAAHRTQPRKRGPSVRTAEAAEAGLECAHGCERRIDSGHQLRRRVSSGIIHPAGQTISNQELTSSEQKT